MTIIRNAKFQILPPPARQLNFTGREKIETNLICSCADLVNDAQRECTNRAVYWIPAVTRRQRPARSASLIGSNKNRHRILQQSLERAEKFGA